MCGKFLLIGAGIVALHVAACNGYDCEEACRRDPPVCEQNGDQDCRAACESYLGTEDCLVEGRRALECFEAHPGACNDYCEPTEIPPAPECIPGCEETLERYWQCRDPLYGWLDGQEIAGEREGMVPA